MMYVVAELNVTETMIAGVPTSVWGQESDRIVLAVHGAYGDRKDPLVRRVVDAAVPMGYRVVSVDLPGHGPRTDIERLVPWECAPELQAVYDEIEGNGRYEISLAACSLGAYFSLLALPDRAIEQTLLLSPLVDMVAFIERFMTSNSVSEGHLRKEGRIPLPGGPELSWEYLTYARENPVRWQHPTRIIWGTRDEIIPATDIDRFATLNGATVERLDAGHSFASAHDAHVTAWLAEALA